MVHDSRDGTAISRIVPYIHVANVQISIDFYALLGMDCRARFGPEGQPYWASMRCPSGDLMIGAASGPIDPTIQAVMFYVYTPDLSAMKRKLLLHGLTDGGDYTVTWSGNRVVFNPRYPDYLPSGEMRVHDPDGYVVLIATDREAVP